MTDPPPFEPDPGLTRGGGQLGSGDGPLLGPRFWSFPLVKVVRGSESQNFRACGALSPCKIAVLVVQNRKIFAPAAGFPLAIRY